MSQHHQPTTSLHGRMRRNLYLLACCQAIGQAGNTTLLNDEPAANDLHQSRVTLSGSALRWVPQMDGSEWRPVRWTPAQLEERRLAAAALLRRGRLTQAAIARRLGVSRASVSRWAAIVRRQGRHGLRARPKAGRPPRLDARAWARLGRLLRAARWRRASGPSAGP